MTFYTNSTGIYARRDMLSACLYKSIQKLNAVTIFNEDDALIGWGLKANSQKLKDIATYKKLPFIHLEDGFIGYIGHPTNGGKSVSICVDKQGIYYQSKTYSDLEDLILQPLSIPNKSRAIKLIESITQFGITKYNCYPYRNSHLMLSADFPFKSNDYVLIVDQVAGDLSLTGANADESTFIKMVTEAKRLFPTSNLVIRTHPDTTFGKKSGILATLAKKNKISGVMIYDKSSHPHSLIRYANAVFTVSSQMGFEALILKKKVYCFGMPFYAGWGLTIDDQDCQRRQALINHSAISIEQLVHGTLINYVRYYHPVLNQSCEVEDIIRLIQLQQHDYPQWETLFLVGFSFWKRSFMHFFCAHLAHKLIFTNKSPEMLQSQLTNKQQILVWGNKYSNVNNILRVEDGFIRSAGLGSNLCKPSSISIDDLGMYFNATRLSKLEHTLMTKSLSADELIMADNLLALLKQQKVSKYNLSSSSLYTPTNTHKEKILVVGQVENDASILTGSPVIKSNLELLESVRNAKPDDWIIYKPHPDVIAKNRNDDINLDLAKTYCDEIILDVPLSQLFDYIDELHTMTSLSGFEALIQGIKVVCWGQPFYAGWGLTEDKHPLQRRNQNISLASLVFCTLYYPHYVDWKTGLYISPELLILLLTKQTKNKTTATKISQSTYKRWILKLGYLIETVSYFFKYKH